MKRTKASDPYSEMRRELRALQQEIARVKTPSKRGVKRMHPRFARVQRALARFIKNAKRKR